MSDSAASHLVDLRDLRLDTAHALVAQAGGSEAALHREVPSRYLQGLIDGLCELSLKDPLTGLANRRHFGDQLAREANRAGDTGRSLSLCVLDIDHFKAINDGHGHLMGDRVLSALGELLKQSVGEAGSTVARYGGEEFAILLPNATPALAQEVAERVRLQKRLAQAMREAADVVGTGQGVIEGPAVCLRYRIKLDEEAGGHVLNVTDWMYLMENGTIMNRSQFTKFGITVAELEDWETQFGASSFKSLDENVILRASDIDPSP